MKKTLTAAALSSLLVLGLANSALAIHETDTAEEPIVAKGPSKVTIDGSVRERGIYDHNNARNAADDEVQAKSYYDSRVQLGVGAKVSEEANAYVRLESGTDSSDVDTWGNGHAAGLFTGGDKNGSLTILEAWVNYSPGGWGVKAGHMPLALGNKVFFDHTGSGDDALVFYGNIGEATHLAALTIKFDEQFTNDSTDDLDGYVLLATTKVNDALNLGANWTYLRGGSDNTNVTHVAANPGVPLLDAEGHQVLGNSGDPNDGGNHEGDADPVWVVAPAAAYDVYSLELMNGLSMSNIGLTADGKIGAIDYLADVEFQFGTYSDISGVHDADVDVNGWAMKLAANYDLGGGKVGLLFGYGSGKDANDDSNDVDAFIPFLTDTTYDTIIAGYRSIIPGNGLGLARGAEPNNSGLSNLTEYQLNGSAKTVCPLTGKNLSLFASVTYLQLSEDIVDLEGDEVDNVGTELDLIATWQLTAGLDYKVEAAYLWTGDVYENNAQYGGLDNDPDNLAFVRHSLDLKF